MNKTIKLASVSMLAVLALTACGSDNDDKAAKNDTSSSASPSDESSPSDEASPTDEETSEAPEVAEGAQEISTDVFTTQVPESWEDSTEEANEGAMGQALISYRAPMSESTDFQNNMNVVSVPMAQDLTEEELFAQFESELEGAGATLTGEPEAVDVNGEDGFRFTSTYGDGQLFIEQVQITRDDTSFVITSTANDEATASETMEMVLASWQWTS